MGADAAGGVPLALRARQLFAARRGQVLAGALLGAAAFLLVYGTTPLNLFSDAWVRGGYVEKDIIQHYTGWLYYRASGWGFPIGMAQTMGWPNGVYVGLSDSIPLFAVFFKLLSPLLPATFQYFGLWAFLCSVMQGACAALLLNLFTRHWLQNLLFSGVFVFAPIFLERQLRHSALGAQWLILLALYLYFKHRRALAAPAPGFIVLSALAMAIHPYFVPMVLAVQFALVCETMLFGAGLAKTRRFAAPLCTLACSVGAALLCGFVLGAFSGGSGGGSTPYGYFSMNLNALFNPTSAGYVWSRFIPVQNQTWGNYDGFNYLGLGLLAVWVVLVADALLHIKKWLWFAFIKRRAGLVFVCLCLSAFAVSNVVTAKGATLFRIPLPQAVTQLATIFRSSGRMFYPVWYLLCLGACVYLVRRLRPKPVLSIALAGGLLVVQLADISPALAEKHRQFHPYAPFFEPLTQSGFWQQAEGRYTHMASLDEGGLTAPIDAALWAVDNGLTTNDAFTARYDPARRAAQIEADLEALRTGAYDENTLYITSSEETFLNLAEALDGPCYCALVDGRWFVIAPQGAAPYTPSAGDVPIGEYQLKILDYSDIMWENGVIVTTRQTVCFTDSLFARRRIDGMRALKANGVEYPITEVSYKDAGWIMVTLDIEDAGVLKDVPITGVP